MQEHVHVPVLLHETITNLNLSVGQIILDGTLGNAGHSKEICERIGKKGLLIGFDLDTQALSEARNALSTCGCRFEIFQRNFRELDEVLAELSIQGIDAMLLDLGWRSEQLSSGRGFSFQNLDDPLLMNFSGDREALITGETVVNEWSENNLADIIYGFGEERYARRIAKAIAEARRKQKIETVGQLVEIIDSAVPSAYKHGRIHPATRTFQAIRMAVNDELGALNEGLEKGWKVLKRGGRIAVISFHSIEDRVVKRAFKQWVTDGEGKLVFKKPLTASQEEQKENPRARSAKLRVIEKL